MTELLFPPGQLCPVCFQEHSLQKGLGQQCLNKLMLITEPYCIKCGKPLRLHPQFNQLCKQCETTELFFEKARAVALYEGALREYLADLKYRFRPELGQALGELLVEWVRANPDFRKADLVIPIPVHPHKLAARGYNQAELLAYPLADYLGMVVKNRVLVRTKLTETQNSLNRVDRFLNVKNAFEIINTSAVSGRRVLLIDDILTTGATVSEAARLLLKAGATEVNVLTLATGIIEPD
ncbi:MAG TPA: ComF family protein [Bacillota bacterium]|nr:ComF family protein [Bacillota bacterium]